MHLITGVYGNYKAFPILTPTLGVTPSSVKWLNGRGKTIFSESTGAMV